MTLEAETVALVTGEILEMLILVEGETLSDTICEAETVVLTNTEGLTDSLVDADELEPMEETLPARLCEVATVVLMDNEGLPDLLIKALGRKDGQTLCDTLENSEN